MGDEGFTKLKGHGTCEKCGGKTDIYGVWIKCRNEPVCGIAVRVPGIKFVGRRKYIGDERMRVKLPVPRGY